MTKLSDLRKVGKAMREAFTCPTCGKSLFVAATSPTTHERIDPNKHCTCPGGPADQAYGGSLEGPKDRSQ